jgi:hypothetical protein
MKTIAVFVSFGMVAPEDSSTAHLFVSADSRADIVCNPSAVQFNATPFGQTPSQTVDLEYAGKLAWQITNVTTPAGAPFDATVKETDRGPGAVAYRVTVRLKADAAPGPFRENVYLETNDPSAARLPLLVEGSVQWPREVWHLGTVKAGEALTRRLELRGNQPFLVVGLEAPKDVKLASKPDTQASRGQAMTLQLQPAQPGAFRRAIKIKTDLLDTPMIVVIDGVAAP